MQRRGKNNYIGLDIGASAVRMIQLADHDGEVVVQAAARCEIPAAVASAEERAVYTQRVIREALATHPFCGREVVTALGTGEFQMKNIRLPRMPHEEMEQAVQFEAQDRFEMGDGAVQLRFIPAGAVRHGNEIREEVIVFAARDDLVLDRLEMLKAAGLEPVAVDLAPCAVARSFIRFLRRSEDAAAVNVFLDVGRRGSSVVITHGSEVVFIKMIEIGGDQMNAAAAQALGISEPEAAELRVRIMQDRAGRRTEQGVASPVEIQTRVRDSLRPLAERISRDVQLCLRYFAVTFRGQRPDSLTLVGGEAHESAMMQVLDEAIDIPCTIGHPLRGVGRAELAASRGERTLQPAWAVAMGLALRGSPWVRTTRPGGREGIHAPAAASEKSAPAAVGA